MNDQINKAAQIIKSGGVILYPTDTIWGLGCNPEDEKAIEKLNSIKGRTADKNYIILIHEERLLNRYVDVVPEVAYDLIDNANRPLTIIYPKAKKGIAHLAGEDGSIAIRITKDKFCVDLIKKCNAGIISTSANKSGEAYNPDGLATLAENVDFSFDLGMKIETRSPSQIISLKENGEFKIIRG